jgi:hypothetical protein
MGLGETVWGKMSVMTGKPLPVFIRKVTLTYMFYVKSNISQHINFHLRFLKQSTPLQRTDMRSQSFSWVIEYEASSFFRVCLYAYICYGFKYMAGQQL